jgi:glucose dehydrogenase
LTIWQKTSGRIKGACIFRTALLLAGAAATLSAQSVHLPSTADGEWPTYGGDLASTKYSPLDQITKDNFAKLKIAWRIRTPDSSLTMTMPGGAEWTASPANIFAELKRLRGRHHNYDRPME